MGRGRPKTPKCQYSDVKQDFIGSMYTVYRYFASEFKRDRPFFSLDKISKRISHALNVPQETVRKVIKTDI